MRHVSCSTPRAELRGVFRALLRAQYFEGPRLGIELIGIFALHNILYVFFLQTLRWFDRQRWSRIGSWETTGRRMYPGIFP